MKRFVFLLMLVSITMQFGCQLKPQIQEGTTMAPEYLTALYPELYHSIEYTDSSRIVLRESKQGRLSVELVAEPFEEGDGTADRCYDDPALQEAVKEGTRGLMLDTDPAILAYAWDVQRILQDFSYLPADYFPVHATCYENGVVKIMFCDDFYVEIRNHPEDYLNHYYHANIDVYVSEKDGHIIHIVSPFAAVS